MWILIFMIKRVHHVGVVVRNLDEALGMYEKIFDLKPSEVKTTSDGQVKVAFLPVGDGEIELIQPLDYNSALSRFLQSHGEAIHHISLATNDIEGDVDKIRKEGGSFLADNPVIGAHGVPIIFMDPRTTNDIPIELLQEPRRNRSE